VRTLLSVLFTAALVLCFPGCYYDVEQELYPGTSCDLTNTTYSGAVEPIVSTNCAVPGCHVGGGVSPDLSTYAGVNSNIGAVEQRALITKDMPPSGALSSCDQQKLQVWIDNGANNN
jgi:hypothetical protein